MKRSAMWIIGVILVAATVFVATRFDGKSNEAVRIVRGTPNNETNAGNYYDEPIRYRGVSMLVRPQDIIATGRTAQDVPVITDPKFISTDEADAGSTPFDDHVGLSIFDGERYRFYPLSTLAWHEIVLDQVQDAKVAITYSPLTDSFVPFVVDEDMELAYSGYVWNNNSLILDRTSGTLYSQLLGRGVYGRESGRRLMVVPHTVIPFGVWKEVHPDGMVLSTETGSSFAYDVSPYGTYLESKGIYFPRAHKGSSGRRPKDALFGLAFDGAAKAYDYAALESHAKGIKNDVFGGKAVLVWVDDDGAVHANERGDYRFTRRRKNDFFTNEGARFTFDPFTFQLKGEDDLLPLYPVRIFWFAWSATYPQTEIYGNVISQGLIDGPFVVEESANQDGIRIEVDDKGIQAQDSSTEFQVTDIQSQ